MHKLKTFVRNHPLAVVMATAAAIRLAAAIFSKGFGMHDDHFCVIEVAQRWVDGYRDWVDKGVHLRSVVYPGLHYLLFRMMEALGVSSPQTKMLVARLLHGAYSLLTVLFGYKLAEKLSGRKTAVTAGMILAAFWLFPYMSVRNLIEFVCIPPLMIGTYMLCLPDSRTEHGPQRGQPWAGVQRILVAGAMFGLAFTFRFQTAVMAATVVLVYLAERRPHRALQFGIGAAAAALCIQGVSDWAAYGYPFASVFAYLEYNRTHAYCYVVGPWYQYAALLAGVLIPPLSLMLLFGYARSWNRWPPAFWPSLAYLAAHSLFPGKQERFILPILPLIIVVGVAGWQEYADTSPFWQKHKRTVRLSWIWFWSVNAVLLMAFSCTYSKKARVETLSYLSGRNDVRGVVLESPLESVPMAPRFYLGRYSETPLYYLPADRTVENLLADIRASSGTPPNYFVLMGEKNIDSRRLRIEEAFGALEPETVVKPGFLDWAMHKINPRFNINYTSYVFKAGR